MGSNKSEMNKLMNITVIAVVLVLSSCSTTKTMTSLERDGSSFEQAIVVKSISEEYEYVQKQCSSCELQSQSLTFDNKKPYDILYVVRPDGEEVAYYFDISEFFGKNF